MLGKKSLDLKSLDTKNFDRIVLIPTGGEEIKRNEWTDGDGWVLI